MDWDKPDNSNPLLKIEVIKNATHIKCGDCGTIFFQQWGVGGYVSVGDDLYCCGKKRLGAGVPVHFYEGSLNV